MDLLKNIIAKQKEAVAAEKEATGGQRWIQRGKLEQQLREEVQRKSLEEEKKRKRDENERLKELARHLAPKKRKDAQSAEHAESAADVHDLLNDEETEPPLPKQEIFKKLRKMKEPVTLFGESDWQRYTRLCELELLHHEDELMGGQRNAFLNPQDDDEEDEDNLKERASSPRRRPPRREQGDADEDSGSSPHARPGGEEAPDAGSRKQGYLSSSSERDSGVPADKEAAAEKRTKATNTAGSGSDEEDGTDGSGVGRGGQQERQPSKETVVTRWIRTMLQEWEAELKARPEEKKNSAEGKLMTSLQRQTRKDLKPLLRKLRHKELEKDILQKLHIMVQCCEERKYRSAHDTYMLLAIGNAAWPVGVTMVGIHERVGRSKLFSSQVAHILNDETTRKYIQMFKRLMSFCQRRYPADPSQTISLSTIHI
ncbi:Prp18 domain-containing protein [Toxoplasma gondii MAS]|uniref:Pre-mRNA-splicing factor 18 n=1 Tax=Toxoplasma gondii MAS TaxID=943118 RepID=A0A086PTX5_TOXGO|nr:Prp18 domain-containing protein [Toxoplasma gondii MAS]